MRGRLKGGGVGEEGGGRARLYTASHVNAGVVRIEVSWASFKFLGRYGYKSLAIPYLPLSLFAFR